MVALPAATPVTVPPDTVATAVLLLLQVTFWLVALAGAMVGVKMSVLPTVSAEVVLFRVTLVTATVEALTVTAQVAVLPPSTVVTVMVEVPAATAVTVPPDTVATVVLLLLHVTFLFVALEGATVAVKFSELPTASVVDVLFKVTLVTATVDALTVTAQVAVLSPSTVVTVMVALPAATAVTVPPETVATLLLLLLQVTFWLVAAEGVMLANNVSEAPTARVVAVLFRVTFVTETAEELTVTAQAALKLPSIVVTVTVALPAVMPVIVPLPDTVTTAGFPLLHNTFLFVASEGSTLANNISELPTTRVVVVLFKMTPVTGMLPPPPGVTVMAQDAVKPPSTVVTVTVSVPAARPVTNPFSDTDTTAEFVLLHSTSLLVALAGAILANNVSVPPMARVADVLFSDTPVTATLPLLVPLSQDAKEKPIIATSAIIPKTLNVFFIKTPFLLNRYNINKQVSPQRGDLASPAILSVRINTRKVSVEMINKKKLLYKERERERERERMTIHITIEH
jgi:hypothetical protein